MLTQDGAERPGRADQVVPPAAARDLGLSPRERWTAVVVLLLLYALAMVDRQIISMMVAPIRRDLGVSDVQISLLQGFSFALLFCVCGLPFGYLVDRFPRRLVILGGVLIWALATTASGFATTFGHLFAARVFVGVGEAALGPAAISIISDSFPRHRLTFALSIYSIGSLIGNAIAHALSGVVLTAADAGLIQTSLRDWQFAFLVVGLPGLLLAFLVFLFREPPRRQGAATVRWRDVLAFMWANRGFFGFHLAGFAGVMTIAYAKVAWTPTFLMRGFEWSVLRVGATLAVVQFATGVFCFLFSGRIVDMMWRRGVHDAHLRFYVWATLVTVVCGGAAFLATSPVVFFLLLIPSSVATNMAAVAPAALQVVTPEAMRGRIASIYLLVVSLVGMIMGPYLVATLTEHVYRDPERLPWSLTTVIVVIGLISTLLFFLGLRPMRDAYARSVAAEAGQGAGERLKRAQSSGRAARA